MPRIHLTNVPKRRLATLALAALVLALVALVGYVPRVLGAEPTKAENPPSIPDVTIITHDFSFEMPDTLPAGLVRISMVNKGDEVHQAQFFRILPGHTTREFIDALLAGGPANTRAYGLPAGGTDDTSPGLTTRVINQLTEGEYVVACLVVSDGHPHFHLGMVGTFTVAADAEKQTPQEPKDDGAINEIGMRITLPDDLSKPGLRIFKVTNSGGGIHALDLLQPLPGKTTDDIQAYLRSPGGPAPFTYLGGMGGQTPGSSGWIIVNLHPGDYVAACLVVDPATRTTHASMGMIASFTVA
jgi:hypothetical protein